MAQIPFVQTHAPMVSFRKPVGSISVSGHKFIGSPVPCGVVMTRQKHIMALSSNVEYLNSRDATIMGSRNGHAPIYLWYMLTKKGYSGIRKDVEKCLRNAHVLKVRGAAPVVESFLDAEGRCLGPYSLLPPSDPLLDGNREIHLAPFVFLPSE